MQSRENRRVSVLLGRTVQETDSSVLPGLSRPEDDAKDWLC